MYESPAIEKNREALKRILVTLLAMAGLANGADPGASALPRRLYRAVLALLRPAESAARRLIIAAARGLAVTLKPPRPRKPQPPKPDYTALRRLGIAVTLTPAQAAAEAKAARAAAAKAAARAARPPSLPLLDPLKRPFRRRRKYVPAHLAPRISWPDSDRRPLPPPPSLYDPIDARRLGQRLSALGRALDDLPGEAKRFARWKARRDAWIARGRPGKFRRVWPLRVGRPPGGRLSRYDPDNYHLTASGRRRRTDGNIREIDKILAHAHALAQFALDRPDTS